MSKMIKMVQLMLTVLEHKDNGALLCRDERTKKQAWLPGDEVVHDGQVGVPVCLKMPRWVAVESGLVGEH